MNEQQTQTQQDHQQSALVELYDQALRFKSEFRGFRYTGGWSAWDALILMTVAAGHDPREVFAGRELSEVIDYTFLVLDSFSDRSLIPLTFDIPQGRSAGDIADLARDIGKLQLQLEGKELPTARLHSFVSYGPDEY